ncbi:hypothetical protein Pan153_19560 [Gimesia panareensis]|uniref:Uncharacterized protein n=1 Tax=Gimesia panareensis TaxID=2527978 RepID=A0A518FLT8_9PLAN|nr:hypothetical protein [Gimesia panareensis]QDV17321.1 hypothetical protein Pan153_19560 [Gimesia panareensis]
MFCHRIMRHLILNAAILTTVWGCQPTTSDKPTENVTDATTEAQQFSSPAEVTAALEARWSLDDIRTFCIPERRHNPMYQNLVTDVGETWEGTLYENVPTGFRSISWYGTAVDGKLHEYSLNASRGDDGWLLEIGNVKSFAKQPNVAPDPSSQRFIGSAPPENQEPDDTFVAPVKRD